MHCAWQLNIREVVTADYADDTDGMGLEMPGFMAYLAGIIQFPPVGIRVIRVIRGSFLNFTV